MNIAKLLIGCEGEKFYTLDRGEMTLLGVDKYGDNISFIKEEELHNEKELRHNYQLRVSSCNADKL